MRRLCTVVALLACAPTTTAHGKDKDGGGGGGPPDARIVLADAKIVRVADARGSGPMHAGFDKAQGAFRDYAAGQEVRGWATGDGTVITPDQNLGRLFVEAGAWGPAPIDLPALLQKVIWAMGTGNRMHGRVETNLDPKGVGTLMFQVGYVPPGPALPREQLTDCKITMTSDHEARLARTPAKAPPPGPLDQLAP